MDIQSRHFVFRPDLTHRQVRQIILDTAEPIASLFGIVATGGRLNARAALSSAIAVPEPSAVAQCLVAIAVLGFPKLCRRRACARAVLHR